MRINILCPLAALLAASGPLNARDEQVFTGPAPDWVEASDPAPVPADATGLVFVRRQDVLVHFDDRGQSIYQGQRIKLLHPRALDAGNLALTWNPAAGAPTVHMLRIHRDGETIDVLANNEFEILRREDQLEQAMLDGLLTAVLQVPDLRVGDELEWAFTSPSHDPTLQDDSFGVLALGPAPPSGRFRLGLSWEEGEEPAVRLTKDLAGLAQRGSHSLKVSLDDPRMLSPPKDAPPRYNWQRVIEYSDFASWPAVSERFGALFAAASQLAPDSPARREAARIAGVHSGALERAQAALELVQQQVRYIYVGLDGGNFDPASADETWQRRYGDCKGKSALLLALLRELGIEAEVVLVNNSGMDDGFDARLPNPGLFDHVLVRARIGGKTYWLDGTLPDVAEAGTRPIMPYRWVLPMTEAGSSLEAIRFEPFALPREMGLYEIDARAGFEQPGRITQTSVKRGIEGLAEYLQFSALTRDQMETSFRGALVGSTQWDAIEAVEYRYDRETQASILTITGTGPVDWEDGGAGEFQLVLPGGGFSPPGRRQRSAEQNQDAPFDVEASYSCYATTVRLPEGTDIENWGFNSVFDTKIYGRLYYRMMERRDDGTIRLVRGARAEESEISPDGVRRDNERLSKFDNSKTNITYDPNRTMDPWGKLTSVPATYEIDWTGPDAPCLPKDVL